MNNCQFQHRIPARMWIKNGWKSKTASEFFEFSTFSTHPTTTTITTIIYPSFLISAPPDEVNKSYKTPSATGLGIETKEKKEKKEEIPQEILHEIHYKQIRIYARARAQYGYCIQ